MSDEALCGLWCSGCWIGTCGSPWGVREGWGVVPGLVPDGRRVAEARDCDPCSGGTSGQIGGQGCAGRVPEAMWLPVPAMRDQAATFIGDGPRDTASGGPSRFCGPQGTVSVAGPVPGFRGRLWGPASTCPEQRILRGTVPSLPVYGPSPRHCRGPRSRLFPVPVTGRAPSHGAPRSVPVGAAHGVPRDGPPPPYTALRGPTGARPWTHRWRPSREASRTSHMTGRARRRVRGQLGAETLT